VLKSRLVQLKEYISLIRLAAILAGIVTVAALLSNLSNIASFVGSFYKNPSIHELIAQKQALPQFEIGMHQITNQETGKADNNVITINNIGALVREFHVDVAVFLNVQVVSSPNHPPIYSVSFQMPVDDFFPGNAVTARRSGILSTLVGPDNNAKYIKLRRGLWEAAKKRDFSTADAGYRVTLKINYFDILDREHEDFYYVPHVGEAVLLDQKEGKELFLLWKDAQQKGKMRELAKLTPDILLDEASILLEAESTKHPPFPFRKETK
jgi:hypothetical protein